MPSSSSQPGNTEPRVAAAKHTRSFTHRSLLRRIPSPMAAMQRPIHTEPARDRWETESSCCSSRCTCPRRLSLHHTCRITRKCQSHNLLMHTCKRKHKPRAQARGHRHSHSPAAQNHALHLPSTRAVSFTWCDASCEEHQTRGKRRSGQTMPSLPKTVGEMYPVVARRVVNVHISSKIST